MISWFLPRPTHPAAIAYLKSTPRSIPRRTPVDALVFLVVDSEATGFRVGLDRMLSIAAVETQAGRILVNRSQSWLVYQAEAPVNAAMAVHGILPSESAGGIPEETMMEQLLPRLTGAVIVGHHVRFDAEMIERILFARFSLNLRNPLLDTATLAMHELEAFRKTGYVHQKPPALDELCAHLDVPMLDRHTAAGDAFTTAHLLLLMLARMRLRLQRPLRASDLPLTRL